MKKSGESKEVEKGTDIDLNRLSFTELGHAVKLAKKRIVKEGDGYYNARGERVGRIAIKTRLPFPAPYNPNWEQEQLDNAKPDDRCWVWVITRLKPGEDIISGPEAYGKPTTLNEAKMGLLPALLKEGYQLG
jgi:hypothetical protein